jgi:hypothetical protein
LKLVHETSGNTLDTIGIGLDFLSRTPSGQQLRERMDKWDYMKLKNFFTGKEIVSKLKRPHTEWEKRLITRICRQLKTLNSPKLMNQ